MKGKKYKFIIWSVFLLLFISIVIGIISFKRTDAKANDIKKEDTEYRVSRNIEGEVSPVIIEEPFYDDYYKGEIVVNQYGELLYAENDKILEDFTGVVTCFGNTYYFKNGVIDFEYSGIVKDENRGLFIIKNGVRELRNTNGFFSYEGRTYYFHFGRAFIGEKALNGVYKYADKYYKLLDSAIDESFSGITTFKGSEILMRDGICDTTLCCEYEEKGKRYYIRNGKVDVCRSMFANDIFDKLARGQYNSLTIREIIDKYNFDVPKSVEEQMKKGRKIKISELIPGDFIYVSKGLGIIEPAMYIGRNDVVFVNPCENDYYYIKLNELLYKYSESSITCVSFFSRN